MGKRENMRELMLAAFGGLICLVIYIISKHLNAMHLFTVITVAALMPGLILMGVLVMKRVRGQSVVGYAKDYCMMCLGWALTFKVLI